MLADEKYFHSLFDMKYINVIVSNPISILNIYIYIVLNIFYNVYISIY